MSADPGTPAGPAPAPAPAAGPGADLGELGARVAGAPISWGVCEVPDWGFVLPVDAVLGEMARLGLRATELGPPGFLPDDPAELRAALERHGLRLVAGFLAAVLHDEAATAQTLAEAERSCAQLAAGGAQLLVLAAATGLTGYDRRPDLDPRQWDRLLETAARLRDLAAGYGLRTALHPHVGTEVESGAEVQRFLAGSDLPLCLDTGHLLIGGSDPVALARAHPERIAHVHLKDVDRAVVERVRAGELTYMQGVQAGMYVPLGDGEVAVAELVAGLESAGYSGWYVLEQDTALPSGGDHNARQPLRDTERGISHLAGVIRSAGASPP